MILFIFLNFTALLLTFAAMFLIWKWGIRMKKASVVDVFWSLIIAFMALYFLTMTGGQGIRAFLLISMIFIWAIRLSFYIIYRSDALKIEDSRYQKLKDNWGTQAQPKMLKFYFQQGAGGLLFAWPAFFVGISHQGGLGFFEVFGFLIWLAAILCETNSDIQLIQFKANPENKGKVCREGFWRYSRHPNYFFEWMVWVGIFFFTLGSPFGWITIVCPASMFYFLNFVTGVPFTEKESPRTKSDAYIAYQQEVNAFFPWYPRLGRGRVK